jgi:glycosyltransferase involved in cell wall biosynthesis
VFLLPSICEGSATVVYEALAAGLPVICTPNTGSVIRAGYEGFIVPIRNSSAIVEKLERFMKEESLLVDMGQRALERAKEFTLAKYGQRLVGTILNAFGDKLRG